MTQVTEDLDLPSGVDPANVVVTVYLAGEDGAALPEAYNASTGKTIVGRHRLNPATDGTWSLELDPNEDLTPTGTVWARTVSVAQPGGSPFATVPATGGPYRWDQILASPPGALTPAALTVLENKHFTPHVTRSAAWGQRWFAARDEADTRQVRVHVWGGSITEGNPGNSDPLTTSWPGLVFAELQSKYGDGGSGYLNGYWTSSTGTWAMINGMASRGHQASAAASLRWEGLAGTRIRLWHRNRSGDGSFRWRIDEGSWRTVNPPTGFGAEPGVDWFNDDFTTLADTPHTVDVEWLSGEIVIYGVMCDRETGIVPCRCAAGGRAAGQFGLGRLARFPIGITDTSTTITSPAPGVFNSSMEDKYLSSVDAGLPADAQITAVTDSETATINNPATATDTITTDLAVNPLSYADFPRQSVFPFLTHGLGLPDLLLCAWGVNDIAYTGGADTGTVSTNLFREGASNLLRAYYGDHNTQQDYSPDLVVIGEHLATWGGPILPSGDPFQSGAQIAAAVKELAIGLGGAHVNSWGIGQHSAKYVADQEWMADVIHPNDLGSQVMMADPVIALLTS